MNNTEEERRQEQELRLILEHGIPDLAAPQDRMRQIRQRVSRRRRRRRLAVLAAVTGVVAAGLLGTLRMSGPADGRTAEVAAPQRTTTTPAADDLGLILRTGSTWYTLTTPDAQSLTTVFAANQPLTDRGTCTETTSAFSCSPVDRLGVGEVLIAFRQVPKPHKESSAETFAIAPLTDEPGKSCRRIGGDQQMIAWGLMPPGASQRPAINAYVCLRRASPETIDEVRELLATASLDVSDPAVDRNPTSAPSGSPSD
ncbi:hypothetical protein OG607_21470 [Streptomyces sp. NBC_01537]|uniref:hypothetical protein n=1 Tax=Streptomyces sp. NBC_01537 TaxID=2903896 RepID=UPI00387028A5